LLPVRAGCAARKLSMLIMALLRLDPTVSPRPVLSPHQRRAYPERGVEPGDEVAARPLRRGLTCSARNFAVMSLEIGGGNGIQPLMAAGHLGLPVVDADTMGRAHPEAQMTSVAVGGLRPYPCVLCDPRGIEAVVDEGAELEVDGVGQPQDLRRIRLDRVDLQRAAPRE
jgi:hypothetical protein